MNSNFFYLFKVTNGGTQPFFCPTIFFLVNNSLLFRVAALCPGFYESLFIHHQDFRAFRTVSIRIVKLNFICTCYRAFILCIKLRRSCL